MEAVLDCAEIRTRNDLHDALTTLLPLPEWYGRNLDALHDCLTDPMEPTILAIRNADLLPERLQGYGKGFLAVLRDCAAQNPAFQFRLE